MALSLSFVHPALLVSVVVPVASARTDTRGMNRVLSESVNAVDLATIATAKGLMEAARAGNPQPTLGTAKALQEFGVVGDAITMTAQFFRIIGDTAGAGDTTQVMTGKALADAAAAGDGTELVAGKTLSDAVASTDATRFASTKALADEGAAFDAWQTGVAKQAGDVAGAADAGLVRLTDYADIAYFTADYVGTSRTF